MAKAMFREWDTSGDGSLSHSELKRSIKKQAAMRPLLRSEGFHWKDVWATYDVDNDGSVGEAEFVRFYKETVAPVIYESSEDHGTARWRQNISQGKSSAPSVSDPFPVFEVSPMNALLNSPPQAGQEQVSSTVQTGHGHAVRDPFGVFEA